ncbi:hypothetical protein IG631_22551 [Alternaria alternata]|nr:hypothetical protein IG631_22551 [Alternaria alternata]
MALAWRGDYADARLLAASDKPTSKSRNPNESLSVLLTTDLCSCVYDGA